LSIAAKQMKNNGVQDKKLNDEKETKTIISASGDDFIPAFL
jgi:hypothetical protein